MPRERRACSSLSTRSLSPCPTNLCTRRGRGRAQRAGLDAFVAVDLPVAALVLAQGAGRLIRTKHDRGVVAVLDPRLAKQAYRAQLLAAMPPLRRSIDLAEACAFLEEVSGTQGTSAKDGASADGAASFEPHEIRTDLPTESALMIRNFFACSVCGAQVSERCRDDGATSAYLHEARVRLATA